MDGLPSIKRSGFFHVPRSPSSIEKIRAELAWVNETPDPNPCGCRNVNRTTLRVSSAQRGLGLTHSL
jgi:hypothetical protein